MTRFFISPQNGTKGRAVMIGFTPRKGLNATVPGTVVVSLMQELCPLAVPHVQLFLEFGKFPRVRDGKRVTIHAGISVWRSVRYHSTGASTPKYVAQSRRGPLSGPRVNVEKLWRDFFSDPSKWWDNRAEKVNTRYPDFKHKKTQQSLWLHSNLAPTWVEAKLAALAPGTLQSDIVSWNIRLRRNVKAGNYKKTIELFQQLQQEGMRPNKFTFIAILNACARSGVLEEGRRIHAQLIQNGHDSDPYVASCLVDMYGKCGSIEDAWRVFSKMPSRDVVSWNVMILGYVKCGEAEKALELSGEMYREGVEPSHVTFVGLLTACANVAALEEGRLLHEQITQRGYESDVFVASSLVDMYAKCGSVENAQRVFNNMRYRDVVSWTTMILGYVKCGEGQKALELSQEMYAEGLEPDSTTFVAMLNACASVAAFEEGKLVHKEICRRGYESNIFVASSLVDMYAKCGRIEDAQRIFIKMPSHTLASWNAMILGYVKCGEGQKALELFREMYLQGVEPSPTTFVGVLNACASIAALDEGKLVHEHIRRNGYEFNGFVASSLVDMYAKCGSIEDAQKVFKFMPTRDLVSWNAMLAGYAMNGWAKEALEHFECMSQDVDVDGVTFGCLLSACSHGGFSEEGVYYFESMNKVYNVTPMMEHYACIVDLLGRAGNLHKAEDLIGSMPCEPDASVWRTLLAACRLHGNVEMGEHVAKRVLELEPEKPSGYLLLSKIYSAVGRRDTAAILDERRLWRGVNNHRGRTWIEANEAFLSRH